jgi:hypothetical protein
MLAVTNRLDEDVDAEQQQRHQAGEGELEIGVGGARGGGRELRQDQGQRGQRDQHGERRTAAFHAKHGDMVAQRAGEQAEADNAVADDHYGREDGIAGERVLAGAAGKLERDDQRDFDDGDGEGEDQGAEGFADIVGDGLRVLDGYRHAGDQHGGERQCDQPAGRPAPDGAKHRAGEDRRGDGPWRQGERLGQVHVRVGSVDRSGQCGGANGKQYTDDWNRRRWFLRRRVERLHADRG